MTPSGKRVYSPIAGAWPLTITLILSALICGCSSDGDEGDSGSGGVSVVITECTTEPAEHPTQSGSMSGAFDFGDASGTAFPLSLDIDTEAGRFSGSLSFRDRSQSYSGAVDGTVSAEGVVAGDLQVEGGANGRVIRGDFDGAIDGLGGCGTWSNEAGQSGLWQVGERGQARSCEDSGQIVATNELIGLWRRTELESEHKGKEYLTGGVGYTGRFEARGFERYMPFTWTIDGSLVTERRDDGEVRQERVLELAGELMQKQRQDDCRVRQWQRQ